MEKHELVWLFNFSYGGFGKNVFMHLVKCVISGVKQTRICKSQMFVFFLSDLLVAVSSEVSLYSISGKHSLNLLNAYQ